MIRLAGRLPAVAAGAVIVTAGLAGCGGGAGTATPSSSPTTSSSPATSASASPSPSVAPEPSPTSSAVLPTDCNTLASAGTRAETVGDMTLQSNGEGFVRPAPAGATLALGCDWIVGDATGVLLLISTATPEAVTAALATLPAQGYTCQTSDDFGAQFCTLPGANAETEEMIVAREGVWIYLSTANRNGRAFLSEIVQGIFG